MQLHCSHFPDLHLLIANWFWRLVRFYDQCSHKIQVHWNDTCPCKAGSDENSSFISLQSPCVTSVPILFASRNFFEYQTFLLNILITNFLVQCFLILHGAQRTLFKFSSSNRIKFRPSNWVLSIRPIADSWPLGLVCWVDSAVTLAGHFGLANNFNRHTIVWLLNFSSIG